MDFEILIDDMFINISNDNSLNPIDRKHVLSLINDFQEGNWRHSKFHSFILDNIAETALSFSERESLVDQSQSKLVAAAKSLRLTDSDKDIGQGSELAEIVLYGVMKNHFKALPVVPKIFYKQNSQDNAKGADSVHIVIDGKNEFTIWFGEAKFYNDISDSRLSEIIDSVGNSLSAEKLKRENAIITNVSDFDKLIDDEKLRNEIKNAIREQESIDKIKPKINIPILLLHECNITANTSTLNNEYKQSIIEFHKDRATSYFKKHINKLKTIHLYQSITFHLILFPVPNKKIIIDRFTKDVKYYKGASSDE